MSIIREEKAKIMKDFAVHAADTGSTPVQVALLTDQIKVLTDHCQKFAKDHSSKRGLLKKVNQRKQLLKYMERHDKAGYKNLIERLGLRK